MMPQDIRVAVITEALAVTFRLVLLIRAQQSARSGGDYYAAFGIFCKKVVPPDWHFLSN